MKWEKFTHSSDLGCRVPAITGDSEDLELQGTNPDGLAHSSQGICSPAELTEYYTKLEVVDSLQYDSLIIWHHQDW